MEKTYQIITDATADLNAELMQESGLEMLPMDVEIEGKRYSYAPVGGDLGEAEFYRALQAGKRASTSQINPLVYESCFERFLKAGMDVLYVCFTSGLSGTIMAAQTCMEELRERYPARDSWPAGRPRCSGRDTAWRRRRPGWRKTASMYATGSPWTICSICAVADGSPPPRPLWARRSK